MSSEHTKEPWHHDTGFPNIETDTANIGGILGDDGNIVCTVWADGSIGERQAEANARRIVACVNACEGLPVEELEQYVKHGPYTGYTDLKAERDQLRSQNAELVEAAVLLLGQYDASGDFKMGGKLTNEPFLKFRHVLAKVT